MAKKMFKIRDISIRNKLVSIQFFTCMIVLLLCCIAFVINDVNFYKESRVKNLSSMAQVIGSSSISSLQFLDNVAANDILSDLRVETDVMNAVIFDKNGNVFATYTKKGSDAYLFLFPVAQKLNFEFKEGGLFVYHKIVDKGEIIGTVCLYAELSQLNNVIWEKVKIAVIVLVVGMVLAFLIAAILQKYISKPIFSLVNLVQKISASGDYKDRAPVEGKDEIGALSMVFNNMMEQIEKRDHALSENINLLNSILQSMGDGVVVVDKNGKFILWNSAAEKIAGFGLEEMYSMDIPVEKWPHVFGLYLPDTETLLKPNEIPLVRSMKGEALDNFEFYIKNSKIQEGVFLNGNARPLKDQSGSPIGAVVVFSNVTERRKMEDALRITKQQLQDIMDNSPAVIFIKKPDGQYLFTNRRHKELFRTSRDKVIGITDYKIWPKEFADRLIANDKQVFETGKPFTYEERVPQKDGIHTYISVKFPMRDATGMPYAVCGISTDITDRKRAEEINKKRAAQVIRFQEVLLKLTSIEINFPLKEKLKKIIEMLAKTIVVERVSIWFFDVSRSAITSESIYLLSKKEHVSGMTILKQEYPAYFQALEVVSTIDASDAVNDPRTSEFSENYLKPFGITSMMDVPIRLGGGVIGVVCLEHVGPQRIWSYEEQVFASSIAGIIALALENHDRELAEIQLSKINKELEKAKIVAERAKEAKDIFLASMSHEIRTPLNAIIGFQQLLKETPLNEEQKEFVESIDFAGRNLLVIINDILDFSKIEAGKFQFNETEFNISDITHSVVELVGHRAREKNIKLLIIQDPAIPEILIGDSARLSQVLLNFIGNAVKFTERGEVKISILLLEETTHDILCEFLIEDTGIGISEDKLAIIFDRFTQVNADTTRKYGGTGLGLAISRHLVEMQGGKINVKSQIGKGSVFSFQLRFKKNEGKPKLDVHIKKTTQVANIESVKPLKVLLAEDIELNQRLVVKIFKKWGHLLDVASNGKEAIEKLEANYYDLILMDIQMPEMDGYQATVFIRSMKDETKKQVPIIALTAHASHEEREKCLKLGINAYISKPFSQEELFQNIYHVLEYKKENIIQTSFADLKIEENNIVQLYDLNFLEQQSDGDKTFIYDMIQMFIESVPEIMHELQKVVDERNYKKIAMIVHKMKNWVIPFQINKVIELASLIEGNARSQQNIEFIKSKMSELEKLLTKATESLKEELLRFS